MELKKKEKKKRRCDQVPSKKLPKSRTFGIIYTPQNNPSFLASLRKLFGKQYLWQSVLKKFYQDTQGIIENKQVVVEF